VLQFSQLDNLRSLHRAKLVALPLACVYEAPSTLYHSLEPLIGYIDFDRVRHWRDAHGSLIASPSSTAAYLMYASVWDDEAEFYLRSVLQDSVGEAISVVASIPVSEPAIVPASEPPLNRPA
jgi:hypothetical protein